MQKKGLGKDLKILCYDQHDGLNACKVACLFRMFGCMQVSILDDLFDDAQTKDEQKLDVKAKGTDFNFANQLNQFQDKQYVDDTIAGKKVGHVIDARSDLEVYNDGKIVDTSNTHFETLDWKSVLKNHKLSQSASENALRIRSDESKDTQITFVGGDGAFVLKAFAEHYNYANISVCIIPIEAWITDDQKFELNAQKITDDIYLPRDKQN